MDYTVEKVSKSEVKLKITVQKEMMDSARQKAADEISKNVKVPGFRPGNVPAEVLEKHIDKKYIEAQAQEYAIQRSYAEAVIKENLQVIARPKVKIESDDPFTYTAEVAILPEVEIKDYKSIKVDKNDPKVTDKDIEDVIEDIKKRGVEYKEVDRAAQNDDRVEIDFEGFDEKGESVPNTKSENHPIIVGSGSLIPGFEDNLVGMKKDEEKEFDLTFPKDYHSKDFQNKKLKFKTKMRSIQEPSTPELDEALIEKATGKKQSPDEFKKDLEKNLQAQKDHEENQRRENAYVEELLKRTTVEIPDSLIDEEVNYIIEDIKHDVSHKGMEFDKFLEQSKLTEDDLRKKYRPEAEKRIKVRLALQQVIKEEGIDVSDADVKAELDKVKSFYPAEQHDKIEQDFAQGDLKNQIINRLTLRKLFDKVLA